MFEEDKDEIKLFSEAIDKSLTVFDELFNETKKQSAQAIQSQSKYIGDSRQRWTEVESGLHRDARGQIIKADSISERYAGNMRQWYLSKIDMTESEKARLKESKLFQILNNKLGIKTKNTNNKGEMIKMLNEVYIATIRSVVTNTTETTLVGDSKAKVGDIVLTKEGSSGKFGSFNIGRVEKIHKADQVRQGVSMVTDIITNSTKDFKALSNELRKKAIKAEIEARMKEVDERQRMMMYAKEDESIKELMAELEEL